MTKKDQTPPPRGEISKSLGNIYSQDVPTGCPRTSLYGGGVQGGVGKRPHFFRIFFLLPSLRGRWTKKTEKKLTNVSLVCMYVGRKSEMSVFFLFFSQQK